MFRDRKRYVLYFVSNLITALFFFAHLLFFLVPLAFFSCLFSLTSLSYSLLSSSFVAATLSPFFPCTYWFFLTLFFILVVSS